MLGFISRTVAACAVPFSAFVLLATYPPPAGTADLMAVLGMLVLPAMLAVALGPRRLSHLALWGVAAIAGTALGMTWTLTLKEPDPAIEPIFHPAVVFAMYFVAASPLLVLAGTLWAVLHPRPEPPES